MVSQQHTITTLVIADVIILEDSQGRYNLNALHQASGAGEHKRPSRWLRNESTQELITELDPQRSKNDIDVIKGGNASGTYAHELLAISYAGWISPAFQLRVNQAFLDMKRGASLLPATRGDLLVQMAEAYRLQEQRIAGQLKPHSMPIRNNSLPSSKKSLPCRRNSSKACAA